MSIKLNSSGGGSVTIQEPTTASNFTLTVPAQTGTVVASDASGNVGIGTNSPVMDGNGSLYVSAVSSNGGTFNAGGSQSGTANFVGSMQFVNTALGTTDKRIATIAGITNGATNSGALVFNTWSSGSGAERARIDSSGNLLVGTTSNASNYKTLLLAGSQPVLRCENTNTSDMIAIKGNAGGSSGSGMYVMPMRFGDDTYRGGIYWNGSTIAYQTSSDYRLKENIQPMTGALAKVSALKPCTYTWKETGKDGQGFIAHELAEVVPDCVTGEKDGLDSEGNILPQCIDTSFLVATLTAAIQEQQAIISDLKARIETLEAK